MMDNPKDDAPKGYLHAWYSHSDASSRDGNSIYKDNNGNEVRVTEVSRFATPMSKWKDLEYKGLVLEGWKGWKPSIFKSKYKSYSFEKI